MTESPAALLRRAADRIEQLATDTTLAPWVWQTFHGADELVHPQEIGGWPVHPLNVMKVSHEDWPPTQADREWMAAMSPVVAPHLSAWLRSIADDAQAVENMNAAASARAERTGGDGHTFVIQNSYVGHAAAFARAVLGEDPS